MWGCLKLPFISLESSCFSSSASFRLCFLHSQHSVLIQISWRPLSILTVILFIGLDGYSAQMRHELFGLSLQPTCIRFCRKHLPGTCPGHSLALSEDADPHTHKPPLDHRTYVQGYLPTQQQLPTNNMLIEPASHCGG